MVQELTLKGFIPLSVDMQHMQLIVLPVTAADCKEADTVFPFSEEDVHRDMFTEILSQVKHLLLKHEPKEGSELTQAQKASNSTDWLTQYSREIIENFCRQVFPDLYLANQVHPNLRAADPDAFPNTVARSESVPTVHIVSHYVPTESGCDPISGKGVPVRG